MSFTHIPLPVRIRPSILQAALPVVYSLLPALCVSVYAVRPSYHDGTCQRMEPLDVTAVENAYSAGPRVPVMLGKCVSRQGRYDCLHEQGRLQWDRGSHSLQWL